MSAELVSRISSPLIQSSYISSLDNAEVHMQGERCSKMLLCAKRILTALGSSITAQYILFDWRILSRILFMAGGLQASLSGIAFESHNMVEHCLVTHMIKGHNWTFCSAEAAIHCASRHGEPLKQT